MRVRASVDGLVGVRKQVLSLKKVVSSKGSTAEKSETPTTSRSHTRSHQFPTAFGDINPAWQLSVVISSLSCTPMTLCSISMYGS